MKPSDWSVFVVLQMKTDWPGGRVLLTPSPCRWTSCPTASQIRSVRRFCSKIKDEFVCEGNTAPVLCLSSHSWLKRSPLPPWRRPLVSTFLLSRPQKHSFHLWAAMNRSKHAVRHHRSGGAGEGEEASGDGEVPESSVWGDCRSLRVQGKIKKWKADWHQTQPDK